MLPQYFTFCNLTWNDCEIIEQVKRCIQTVSYSTYHERIYMQILRYSHTAFNIHSDASITVNYCFTYLFSLFSLFFFSFRSLVMKRIKQRINRCLQKNTINDRLFSRITSLPLFCSHFPLSYDSINERTVYICNQWILLYEVYITCIH